jgi:hypothetical protein
VSQGLSNGGARTTSGTPAEKLENPYRDISGSHGGEYEDNSFLGYSVVVPWKKTYVSNVCTSSIVRVINKPRAKPIPVFPADIPRAAY